MTPTAKKPSRRNAFQSRAIVSAFGPFNLTAHWTQSVLVTAGEGFFLLDSIALSVVGAEKSFFIRRSNTVRLHHGRVC